MITIETMKAVQTTLALADAVNAVAIVLGDGTAGREADRAREAVLDVANLLARDGAGADTRAMLVRLSMLRGAVGEVNRLAFDAVWGNAPAPLNDAVAAVHQAAREAEESIVAVAGGGEDDQQ